MVKEPFPLKDRDFEPQFKALFLSLFNKVPFLQLETFAKDGGNGYRQKFGIATPIQPDWTAEVRTGGRLWTILVETKLLGQPQHIRNATLQLDRYLSLLPVKFHRYGIVLAPYISQESARICEEAGMGYADLAGNARISFDNVYIETRSADNPFRERKEVKSLFAPRACRILRLLLQGPLRLWKTIELAKEADVSMGWVSAVRRQLVAREWAVSDSNSRGFRVSNPNALLDAWAAADDWKARTNVREYSLLLSDPTEIAKNLRSFFGDRRHAFTKWFAGWLRHPYTIPQVVTAYVDDFPDQKAVEEQLLARRVEEGGRLWLVKPSDPGVFLRSQSVQEFILASDLQIYLDLLTAGARGDEQADELRKWPDFAGGWKL
jgi:Transcriptional regulator, AbiEi antitoxin, Type IV TA system